MFCYKFFVEITSLVYKLFLQLNLQDTIGKKRMNVSLRLFIVFQNNAGNIEI